MSRFLRRLFGRRMKLVDLPALCPREYTVSEVQAALSGQAADPRMQAVLQLCAMIRANCLEAAQGEAQRDGTNTHYQLGGVAACEDLMGEITGLLTGTAPSDEVKRYFPQDPAGSQQGN